MVRRWLEEELEKAKVVLNRTQKAAGRKIIAEWKSISREFQQMLKDQRVYRSKLFKLRKVLCVDIRKILKLVTR